MSGKIETYTIGVELDSRPVSTGLKRLDSDVKRTGQGMGRSLGRNVNAGLGSGTKAGKKYGRQLGAGTTKGFGSGLAIAPALGRLLPTLGAGLVAKKFVTSAADIQEGMIGIGKTTGISGDQLDELKKGILDIASTVPITIRSLQGIGIAAGQMGIKTNANILQIIKTMAMMETASDLAGESGALALAKILSLAGEDIGDIDKFGSAVVALGNTYETSESKIAATSTRIAQSVGAFTGFTSAKIVGLGTSFLALGIPAELSGSAISRTLVKISTAADDELSAFAKLLGVTSKQLKKTLKTDAAQVFEDFIGALAKVKKQGGDTINTLHGLGLKDIRLISTLPTLANNFERVARAIELANKSFEENTALTEEFDEANKAYNASTARLVNTMTKVSEALGTKLLPRLTEAQDGLALFAEDALDASEELGDLFDQLKNTFEFKFRVDIGDVLRDVRAAIAGLPEKGREAGEVIREIDIAMREDAEKRIGRATGAVKEYRNILAIKTPKEFKRFGDMVSVRFRKDFEEITSFFSREKGLPSQIPATAERGMQTNNIGPISIEQTGVQDFDGAREGAIDAFRSINDAIPVGG